MSLTTHYLGLTLANPFVPGASPLSQNLDAVRKLEDAGAPAIVMHSLFKEQITREQHATIYHMEMYAGAFEEVSQYLPEPTKFALGPEQYLEHLRKVREAVAVPVIGSINGTTAGEWTRYAELIEQAGAAALELNVYHVPAEPGESSAEVEGRVVEALAAVRGAVTIPVAVKLSPFYSTLPRLAAELEGAGAKGLVLFNRFYQPDVDLETMRMVPRVHLSSSEELQLRLRWLSILSPQTRMSLACSGGVHTGQDAIKAILCGADTVQIVSALLREGPGALARIRVEAQCWMEEHDQPSVRQLQGALNLAGCAAPTAFERGNYLRTMQSWGEGAGLRD